MVSYGAFRVVRFPGEKYGVRDVRTGEVSLTVSKLAAYEMAAAKDLHEKAKTIQADVELILVKR